ncbi:hypothetical protein FNH22_19495 [Fulvivirga sp. M361]|uniref:hypothetical protein n=1 Tax=Fulvivirga sp. M361 TaxID=2594266 RepID=UPI00117AC979|nr:hypothetical protein [Fulvivirga sp. M361]TRX54303.1 hypothetical protein FNH22_19495 [Fulvivirga sp. M361]
MEFDNLTFSNEISDPNNNATSYSLALVFGTLTVDNFVTVNSFPGTIIFTGDMLLDAAGLTINDITPSTEFSFVAIVTTPTGVYTGSAPSFNTSSNTQEGGNTAVNLFRRGLNDAMDFTMTFFVPPPKKLRGTSFEEPFAAPSDGADYIRTGGPTDEGELLNIDGQRHVIHVAVGTGVDDEIGFKSEFFDNGGSGFENEEIGVTRKTEDVGAYVDGVQGFQLEDVDGLFRLTFDKVDIPDGTPRTGVRIQIFFRETSWDDDDTIRIYAEIERSGSPETIELMSANGADINAMEGRWNLADSGFFLMVLLPIL